MNNFLFSLGVTPTAGLPGEIYSSLIVMFALSVLAIVIGIKARRADPLKKPRGIVFLAESFVSLVDGMVEENLGHKFKFLTPYFGFLCAYIFGCFLIGMLGFPSPMTFYWIPFILAFLTFLLINITSIYYKKWGYFKQFVFPIPIVGIFSLFSPILSMSLRLFANGLAGWIMMYLVYAVLENVSGLIFNGLPYFIAPFITPVLHAYFDLFSGVVQTAIFVFLTMLFMGNEIPDAEEEEEKVAIIRKN